MGNEQSVEKRLWHTAPSDDKSEIFPEFESLLQDFTLALEPTGIHGIVHHQTPSRPRVEAILHHLLARSKRKVQNSDNYARLETLSWSYDQTITLPEVECKEHFRDGALSYVLWYGDERELETNIVVIRAEKRIHGSYRDEYLLLLEYMAMIQRNRPRNGTNNGPYGVLTDGWIWIFAYLDNKTHSSLSLKWIDNKQRIVSQLSSIINEAVSLNILYGESRLNKRGLRQQSIWDVQRREALGDSSDNESEDDDPEDELLITAIIGNSLLEVTLTAVKDTIPEKTKMLFDLTSDKNAAAVWRIRNNEWRKTPEHTGLTRILTEYDLAFGSMHQSDREAIIRARIEAILITTLAAKKREAFVQYGTEKAATNGASAQIIASYMSLCWSLERTIELPCVRDGTPTILHGEVNYALWHGGPGDTDTNLVVVEGNGRNGSDGNYEATSYMAMIHHTRKQTGRANRTIFGIATDSYRWTFIYLSPERVISTRSIVWDQGGADEVVSQLHRIMDHAALLSSGGSF